MAETLREKVRAAIEGGWQECTVAHVSGVPPDSVKAVWPSKVFNADEAAGRVMGLIAPLIGSAEGRMAAVMPIPYYGFRTEYWVCQDCRAEAAGLGDIPHEPNCQYIKIRDALCVTD